MEDSSNTHDNEIVEEYVRLWQILEEGDIVDIIAPGYGVKEEDLQAAKAFITSLGLVPRIPDDLQSEHILCSNRDDKRLEHTRNALFAPDSRAVWCMKGGYGTTPIIPALHRMAPPPQCKLVIGFSDITALHLLLNQRWGWPTLHGPVLWQIIHNKVDQHSIDQVADLMFGRTMQQELTLLPSHNNPLPESIEGEIVGGNLMLIENSIGTCWHMVAQDKIILLEEVDEKPYRVDRVLTHLQQANMLDAAKAILLGDFTGEPEDSRTMQEVLSHIAEYTAIPVFRLQGVGHGHTNLPVPLNCPAHITPQAEGHYRLAIESGSIPTFDHLQ